MTIRRGRLAILLGLFALATPAQAADPLAEVQNHANFCDGTYALCIKAPCTGIPVLDRLGSYVIDHALCSCEVVKGWSMGPGQCADRGPVKQNGRTYLISTYSNRFNATNQTLTCPNPKTAWAWCYGAPCVVDENDPNKATCNCPLQQSPMQTLGGDCRRDACDGIWSAAVPQGDTFANNHFYNFMQHNHPGVPVNQAAPACPIGAAR